MGPHYCERDPELSKLFVHCVPSVRSTSIPTEYGVFSQHTATPHPGDRGTAARAGYPPSPHDIIFMVLAIRVMVVLPSGGCLAPSQT